MSRNATFLARLIFAATFLPVGVTATQQSQSCPVDHRPFALRTNEASIANVDVSPDGTHLVFDLLGDIYMVATRGGNAVALTRGNDWDVRPVWSPSGRKIAFVSDRGGRDQIFVLDLDGKTSKQITFEEMGGSLLTENTLTSAEWMPDGETLVVNGNLVRIDAGEPEVIRKFDSGSMYHANGKELYQFVQSADSNPVIGLRYELRKLSELGQWSDMGDRVSTTVIESPSISRDERWLVYKDRRSEQPGTSVGSLKEAAGVKKEDVIVVRDRRSGRERILVGPRTSSTWRSSDVGSVPERGRSALSSDSRFLFTAYGGGLHQVQIAKVDIATGNAKNIPISVSIEHCLEPLVYNKFRVGHEPLRVRNLRSLSLSPDGKQLVFSALRSLYVMDVPGGSVRLLAPQSQGQFHPSYSPDGKWIAYVTWNESEGGHLWRVSARGGTPQRLTERIGYYETPVWAPDGSSIAFVGSEDIALNRNGFSVWVYEGSLQVMDLESRSIKTLADKVRLGQPPSFSEDSTQIHYVTFESNISLQLRMRSVSIEGKTDRDTKLSGLLPSSGTAYAIPSPDGRLVAITKNGNLYLIECKVPIGDGQFNAELCSEKRITRRGAYDVRWRDGGNELEWSLANVYYRAQISDLMGRPESGDAHRLDASRPSLKSIEVNLTVPRRPGVGMIALVGARILTMRADEKIEDGVILVKDGRILSVGSRNEIAIPAGASIVDVTGKTILPGFVDVHAHLDGMPRDLLNANHGEMLINLAFGVTTLRNPSHGGDHGYAYTELLEAGKMVGPRLFGAEALVSSWQEIETFKDASDIALRTKRLGGTFLKYHTGWDRQQRRWIIEAARQNGLNVAAHWPISNFVPSRPNYTTAIDGATTFEHAFSNTGEYADVVKFIASTGAWLNFASLAWDGRYPAYYWEDAKADERVARFFTGKAPNSRSIPTGDRVNGLFELFGEAEVNAKLINSINNAGGKVTIGSHGDYDGIVVHWEMWAHVRGGMSTRDVLRAATINGAEALGIDADLGSLEVGKIADLIILAKNPIDDIRNSLTVEEVMKDGVLRDAKTLDEIWPTRAPLPNWKYPDPAKVKAH